MPTRRYVGPLDAVEVALPSGVRQVFTRDEDAEVAIPSDADALDRHPEFRDPDRDPDEYLGQVPQDEDEEPDPGPDVPPAPAPPSHPEDPRLPDADLEPSVDFIGPPHEEA